MFQKRSRPVPFMLSQATVSWASKKQDCVALSSCEAELMAASDAATISASQEDKETLCCPLSQFSSRIFAVVMGKTSAKWIDKKVQSGHENHVSGHKAKCRLQ